jgi:predicted amidohydrolase
MNSSPERDENVERAARYIDEAVARDKPDLIVIPEFFNHVYVFQYRDYKYIDCAETDAGVAISRMREKAKQHDIHVIATIFEEHSAGN